MVKADHSMRLGFAIDDLETRIKELGKTSWKIVSDLSQTEWGLIAVVQDLDGRKIELKNV